MGTGSKQAENSILHYACQGITRYDTEISYKQPITHLSELTRSHRLLNCTSSRETPDRRPLPPTQKLFRLEDISFGG